MVSWRGVYAFTGIPVLPMYLIHLIKKLLYSRMMEEQDEVNVVLVLGMVPWDM